MPTAFRLDELPAQLEVVRRQPFAVLVTATPEGCLATHLPLLHRPAPAPLGCLIGHLAAANPQVHHLFDRPSLAIFSGPHGYLSPTWYQTRPAVPTWDYVTVHATGVARRLVEPAAVTAVLHEMVQHFERQQPEPWDGQLPEDLQRRLEGAIVVFELPLTAIQGAAKLSQNRSPGDLAGVLAALDTSPRPADHDLAAAIRQARRPGATDPAT